MCGEYRAPLATAAIIAMSGDRVTYFEPAKSIRYVTTKQKEKAGTSKDNQHL